MGLEDGRASHDVTIFAGASLVDAVGAIWDEREIVVEMVQVSRTYYPPGRQIYSS